jgi:hypothetical protein
LIVVFTGVRKKWTNSKTKIQQSKQSLRTTPENENFSYKFYISSVAIYPPPPPNEVTRSSCMKAERGVGTHTKRKYKR